MRARALAMLAGAFLLLIVVWVVTSTEWGEVEIPAPLRGEAATNPFYAAERLVAMLDGTAERRESLGTLGTEAVLVLSTFSWDIDAARRAELERWVEAGGRLVVDAALISGTDAFEVWSDIVREVEEPDPNEGLAQPPQPLERCRTVAEIDGQGAATAELEVCGFPYDSWLATGERLLWGLRADDDALLAARVPVGSGTVTVLNGVPFVARALFDGQHGELFAAATSVRTGDHVVFLTEAEVASLPTLVWRHGAPFVAVLLLWIALALWRGAMRFGPLLAPIERARRSLAEQVLGTGRFVVRVGGGAALLAAARRALNEAAERRIVGYQRLAGPAQAQAVAALANVDARELAAALDPQQNPARLPELRATLALLETARRQLVSRSEWQQHAKRI
jgi:hypothetical protein